MARILGIGIATLDIINHVEGSPAEDSEVRALAQRISRGGNCTNTLVVLSQLGHRCGWGGVLAEESDAARITADLDSYHIDLAPVRRIARGKMPTSYIIVNQRNGSRTIVHYRDLPEYGYDDFAAIDLDGYHWLHLEGRHIDDSLRMLEHARARRPGVPRSVEIEKPRPGIERLYAGATLLLFSRAYARERGYGDRPAQFLRDTQTQAPHAELVLAWGDAGAYALDRDGELYHSPAFPPPRVVDTLGAGDTFNAGVIDARVRGLAVREALEHACGLAGRKCGQEGRNFSGRCTLNRPYLNRRHHHARILRPPRLHLSGFARERQPARRSARRRRTQRRQLGGNGPHRRRPQRCEPARRRSAIRLLQGRQSGERRPQRRQSHRYRLERGAPPRCQAARGQARRRDPGRRGNRTGRAQDGRSQRGRRERRPPALTAHHSRTTDKLKTVATLDMVEEVQVFAIFVASAVMVFIVVRRAKQKAAADEAARVARRTAAALQKQTQDTVVERAPEE